ncbi:beta/gamma crystallin domain-containing protein 1 isoform X1 [Latimeria chalumnae]|uniref:beta/gamma crystallin domain-containing protein 1 isoform X1 n=1 Tax=Latimeria chalumnae TaxID=7897 RepID=UPI00313DABA2
MERGGGLSKKLGRIFHRGKAEGQERQGDKGPLGKRQSCPEIESPPPPVESKKRAFGSWRQKKRASGGDPTASCVPASPANSGSHNASFGFGTSEAERSDQKAEPLSENAKEPETHANTEEDPSSPTPMSQRKSKKYRSQSSSFAKEEGKKKPVIERLGYFFSSGKRKTGKNGSEVISSSSAGEELRLSGKESTEEENGVHRTVTSVPQDFGDESSRGQRETKKKITVKRIITEVEVISDTPDPAFQKFFNTDQSSLLQAGSHTPELLAIDRNSGPGSSTESPIKAELSQVSSASVGEQASPKPDPVANQGSQQCVNDCLLADEGEVHRNVKHLLTLPAKKRTPQTERKSSGDNKTKTLQVFVEDISVTEENDNAVSSESLVKLAANNTVLRSKALAEPSGSSENQEVAEFGVPSGTQINTPKLSDEIQKAPTPTQDECDRQPKEKTPIQTKLEAPGGTKLLEGATSLDLRSNKDIRVGQVIQLDIYLTQNTESPAGAAETPFTAEATFAEIDEDMDRRQSNKRGGRRRRSQKGSSNQHAGREKAVNAGNGEKKPAASSSDVALKENPVAVDELHDTAQQVSNPSTISSVSQEIRAESNCKALPRTESEAIHQPRANVISLEGRLIKDSSSQPVVDLPGALRQSRDETAVAKGPPIEVVAETPGTDPVPVSTTTQGTSGARAAALHSLSSADAEVPVTTVKDIPTNSSEDGDLDQPFLLKRKEKASVKIAVVPSLGEESENGKEAVISEFYCYKGKNARTSSKSSETSEIKLPGKPKVYSKTVEIEVISSDPLNEKDLQLLIDEEQTRRGNTASKISLFEKKATSHHHIDFPATKDLSRSPKSSRKYVGRAKLQFNKQAQESYQAKIPMTEIQREQKKLSEQNGRPQSAPLEIKENLEGTPQAGTSEKHEMTKNKGNIERNVTGQLTHTTSTVASKENISSKASLDLKQSSDQGNLLLETMASDPKTNSGDPAIQSVKGGIKQDQTQPEGMLLAKSVEVKEEHGTVADAIQEEVCLTMPSKPISNLLPTEKGNATEALNSQKEYVCQHLDESPVLVGQKATVLQPSKKDKEAPPGCAAAALLKVSTITQENEKESSLAGSTPAVESTAVSQPDSGFQTVSEQTQLVQQKTNDSKVNESAVLAAGEKGPSVLQNKNGLQSSEGKKVLSEDVSVVQTQDIALRPQEIETQLPTPSVLAESTASSQQTADEAKLLASVMDVPHSTAYPKHSKQEISPSELVHSAKQNLPDSQQKGHTRTLSNLQSGKEKEATFPSVSVQAQQNASSSQETKIKQTPKISAPIASSSQQTECKTESTSSTVDVKHSTQKSQQAKKVTSLPSVVSQNTSTSTPNVQESSSSESVQNGHNGLVTDSQCSEEKEVTLKTVPVPFAQPGTEGGERSSLADMSEQTTTNYIVTEKNILLDASARCVQQSLPNSEVTENKMPPTSLQSGEEKTVVSQSLPTLPVEQSAASFLESENKMPTAALVLHSGTAILQEAEKKLSVPVTTEKLALSSQHSEQQTPPSVSAANAQPCSPDSQQGAKTENADDVLRSDEKKEVPVVQPGTATVHENEKTQAPSTVLIENAQPSFSNLQQVKLEQLEHLQMQEEKKGVQLQSGTVPTEEQGTGMAQKNERKSLPNQSDRNNLNSQQLKLTPTVSAQQDTVTVQETVKSLEQKVLGPVTAENVQPYPSDLQVAKSEPQSVLQSGGEKKAVQSQKGTVTVNLQGTTATQENEKSLPTRSETSTLNSQQQKLSPAAVVEQGTISPQKADQKSPLPTMSVEGEKTPLPAKSETSTVSQQQKLSLAVAMQQADQKLPSSTTSEKNILASEKQKTALLISEQCVPQTPSDLQPVAVTAQPNTMLTIEESKGVQLKNVTGSVVQQGSVTFQETENKLPVVSEKSTLNSKQQQTVSPTVLVNATGVHKAEEKMIPNSQQSSEERIPQRSTTVSQGRDKTVPKESMQGSLDAPPTEQKIPPGTAVSVLKESTTVSQSEPKEFLSDVMGQNVSSSQHSEQNDNSSSSGNIIADKMIIVPGSEKEREPLKLELVSEEMPVQQSSTFMRHNADVKPLLPSEQATINLQHNKESLGISKSTVQKVMDVKSSPEQNLKISATSDDSILDISSDMENFAEAIRNFDSLINIPKKPRVPKSPAPPFAMPPIQEDRLEKIFDPKTFTFGLGNKDGVKISSPSMLLKKQSTDLKSKVKSHRASAEQSMLFKTVQQQSSKPKELEDQMVNGAEVDGATNQGVKRSRLDNSSILANLKTSSSTTLKSLSSVSATSQSDVSHTSNSSQSNIISPLPSQTFSSTQRTISESKSNEPKPPLSKSNLLQPIELELAGPSFSELKLPSYMEKYLKPSADKTGINSENDFGVSAFPRPNVDLCESTDSLKSTSRFPQPNDGKDFSSLCWLESPFTQASMSTSELEASIMNVENRSNPRPGKMVIYDPVNNGEEAIEVYNDVEDSTSFKLPPLVLIRVVRGCWLIYEKPHFEGRSIPLEEGEIELVDMWGEEIHEQSGPDEPLPSPKVPIVIGSIRYIVKENSLCQIDLFTEMGGLGQKTTFYDAVDETQAFGIHIRTNSIKVQSGIWLIFEAPSFQGNHVILEPGTYPNPESWGWQEVAYVGSVRPLKTGGLKVEYPNEPKVIVYEKPFFEGQLLELETDVFSFCEDEENAKESNPCHMLPFASIGSLRVLGGVWVGYEKPGFEGYQYVLEEGEYRVWKEWGGCNEKLQSLRPILSDFAAPQMIMYSEENFGAKGLDINVLGAVPNLLETGYGIKTQSINVLNGVWVAYENVDFKGRQYILEKGLYTSFEDWGADNFKISSIQPIMLDCIWGPKIKFKVLLFSEPNFQGSSQIFVQSTQQFANSFSAKSCKVLAGSWVAYDGENFSGNQYVLEEGAYPNQSTMGCASETCLKSIQIIDFEFSEPSIVLFAKENFKGKRIELMTEAGNLQLMGFNAHTFSVHVGGGIWILYEHSNYRGRQIVLRLTDIPSWHRFSGWHRIGSLQPLFQKLVYFRLRNRETGAYASVTGNLDEVKLARIQALEDTGSVDQIWFCQDGLLKCKVAEDCCLETIGSMMCAGSRLGLSLEQGKENHFWTLTSDGLIHSKVRPDLVLDIKGGQQYDQKQIILSLFDEEKPTQRWHMEIL